jgi:serine/threonine protein kinase
MHIQVISLLANRPGLTNGRVVDIKLDNVLVNYKKGTNRFSDAQLGDLGGTYPTDSKYARKGTPVGAPMLTSLEVIMETPWNTATDIWSFGTIVSLNQLSRTRRRC